MKSDACALTSQPVSSASRRVSVTVTVGKAPVAATRELSDRARAREGDRACRTGPRTSAPVDHRGRGHRQHELTRRGVEPDAQTAYEPEEATYAAVSVGAKVAVYV